MPNHTASPVKNQSKLPVLVLGSKGEDVRQLQVNLNAALRKHFRHIQESGSFRPEYKGRGSFLPAPLPFEHEGRESRRRNSQGLGHSCSRDRAEPSAEILAISRAQLPLA